MDNNKKLSEGLLRADGIDPSGVTEAERAVFREMLESEKKNLNGLTRRTNAMMGIFFIALLGLCFFGDSLERVGIPFIVSFFVVVASMWIVIFMFARTHYKKLKESKKKISKLYYLVHGIHRGCAIVSRKDGKRIVHWSSLIIIIISLWLFTLLSGAGVYYLLCQRWIFVSSPLPHIFLSTVVSLSFAISLLIGGLKAPLDELVEVKAKSKQSTARPYACRTIMKHKSAKLAVAAVIIIAVILGLNIFPGSGIASVALADVAKKIEQIQNCVFKKTTTISSEDNGAKSFDSLVYYTKDAVREDIFDNKKKTYQVYVKFSERNLVGVDHKTKVFKKMELTDEDMEKMSPVSPKNIVNLILGKGTYNKLGRETVDGILSEGFEFSDKRAMLSMDKEKIKNIVTRLWVDIKTNLPIRVEVDCVLINDSKANVVMRDPKWEVELEADFFEPKIPSDYIKPEERGLIGVDLENWPTLKVVSGMPAEKAGVKDGDIVLKVNGNSIQHDISSGDALDLLLGKAGEKVVLTVKRGEQILTFEIERAPMPE